MPVNIIMTDAALGTPFVDASRNIADRRARQLKPLHDMRNVSTCALEPFSLPANARNILYGIFI